MSTEPPQGGDPSPGAGSPSADRPSAQPQGYPPPYAGGPYGGARPYPGQQQPYGYQEYPAGVRYGEGQPPAGPYGYPAGAYPPPHGGHPPYGGPQQAQVGHPFPSTSPDPLVPFSLGDWFAKVVGTVGRSLKPLLLIQALVFVPILLTQLVLLFLGLSTGPGYLGRGFASATVLSGATLLVALLTVLTVVVYALGAVASVFVVVRDAARRPYTRDQVLAFVRHRSLPAIGWTVAAAAVVSVGGAVLGGLLGFFSLLPVLAGSLYAGTVLSALPGVVAVERGGIARIFTLTHPRFFPTLGRLVLAGLASVVVVVVIGVVAGLASVVGPVVGTIVGVVLAVPVAVVASAVVVVVYAENRFHENHAVHTPVLADEIDRP
ncbi:hypothetical protein [Pseudonocardia sp. HH130630-07]|uniref:hypothetical protein n=1 Tax=Pseudonocardia sp. HH130630-07 TaxID=1690815 RepID=UPI0008152201|nr:hypothetical protein [Pseudonocardia sp. HH130630-07]ANY09522.1 hypothetical protein AFB00_28455 [Pseudonocardia sp. HH130630-07]